MDQDELCDMNHKEVDWAASTGCDAVSHQVESVETMPWEVVRVLVPSLRASHSQKSTPVTVGFRSNHFVVLELYRPAYTHSH